MRKLALALLLVPAVIALTATAGHAGGWRGGVFIGVGPYWGWGYPWYYPPPYYYYPPPTVVVEQPPVYVEQPRAGYWYYCASAREYYPKAAKCPEPWIPVAPRPGAD